MQNQIVRISFEDILTIPGLTFELYDNNGFVKGGDFPTNTDCLVVAVDRNDTNSYSLSITNVDGALFEPKVNGTDGCGGIVIVGNVDILEAAPHSITMERNKPMNSLAQMV